VRVPAEAGCGEAKLRLSFDAWEAAAIAPANVLLRVVDASPKPKSQVEQPRPRTPQVADSKELRQTLRQENYVAGLALSPDGKTLAAIDQGKGIHLWDPVTGEKRGLIPLADKDVEMFDLSFSPDGKTLAAGGREVRRSADGHRYEGYRTWEARLWDIGSGKEVSRFRSEQPGSAAVFWLDNHTVLLAVTEGEPGNKRPRNLKILRCEVPGAQQKVIHETDGREAALVAVSPDGRTCILLLRPSEQTVNTEFQVLNVPTGQTRSLCSRAGSIFSHAAITADGTILAASLGGKLRFWDTSSWKELPELNERYSQFQGRPENENRGGIRALCFTRDASLLAIVYYVFDIPSRREIPEIVLWDTSTGGARAVLRGHTFAVLRLAFTPDGRTLITGSHDKTIKLWNVPAGNGPAEK
jgi:WD40 repeat protein